MKALKYIISLAGFLIILSITTDSHAYFWTKTMGGSSNDYAQSVTVDSSGNLYVTGYFYGTADFDPGEGTDNHTSAGGYDIFLTRINADGSYGWTKTMGGSNFDYGNSVTLDGSGNLYVTGYFSGTADFAPRDGTDDHTSAGGYDIFLTRITTDGSYVWTRTMGGPSSDIGNSVTVDGSGDLYVAGYFNGTVDFDPGEGTEYHTSAAGSQDIFLTRIDADGSYGWTRTMGGTGSDRSNSVTVDSSGNLYVTGYFNGTVDFDPGEGTDFQTSAGGNDIFLTMIDTDGTYGWTGTVGGSGSDSGNSVTLDGSGNLYVTGHFNGAVDFDPGEGTDFQTSAGGNDIFLTRINAVGTYGWTMTMGGSSNDYSNSVAVDGSGNLYVAGYFNGAADFDPGEGTDNHTSAGSIDIFLTRINADGSYGWTKTMGGSGGDYGQSVAVDGSGNAYVAGRFYSAVDFNPGPATDYNFSAGSSDIFLSKFSPSLPDSDADGIDDRWEIAYFGDLSHDGSADTDNDGLIDLKEFIYGADPNTPDAEGITERFVYVSNADSAAVSVIDVAAKMVIASISVGSEPRNLASNPAGTKIYVPNRNSDSVSVIDTATNTVTATVTDADIDEPYALAVTPDGGEVWVVNKKGGGSTVGSVTIINTATDTVAATIDNACFYSPEGITINPATNEAYVVNRWNDTVCIVNIASRAVITSVDVGSEPRYAVALPDGSAVYVSGSPVTKIKASDHSVTDISETWGRNLAVSSDGSKVYVAHQSNNVLVINTATEAVSTMNFPGSSRIYGVALAPGTNLGYVTDESKDMVFVFDTASDTALTGPGSVIFVQNTPRAIAAQLGHKLDIKIAPAGAGSVAGNGIICSSDCTGYFGPGAVATLTAVPASGWMFFGWGGDYFTRQNPETISMDSNLKTVAHFFQPEEHRAVLTLPAGDQVAQYQILSLPLVLRPDLPFSDYVGTYDTTIMRIATWDAETQSLDEYPFQPGEPKPGDSAWFLYRNGKIFDFDGYKTPETIVSVNGQNGFFHGLHDGWNMIGNPYNYPISVSSLLIKQGAKEVLLTSAENDLTQQIFWVWVNGVYEQASTLESGQGGWVKLYSDNAMIFFPAGQGRSTIGQPSLKSGSFEKPPGPPGSLFNFSSETPDGREKGGCFINSAVSGLME